MNREQKLTWLTRLWNYHTGCLKKNERVEVERLLKNDPDAQADSKRVREIIEGLRQKGEALDSEECQQRALAPLLPRESFCCTKTVVGLVFLAAILSILVYHVIQEGEPAPPATSSRDFIHSRPHSAPQVLPTPELENTENLSLKLPRKPRFIRSATSSMKLRDPVEPMEKELDDWLSVPAQP